MDLLYIQKSQSAILSELVWEGIASRIVCIYLKSYLAFHFRKTCCLKLVKRKHIWSSQK